MMVVDTLGDTVEMRLDAPQALDRHRYVLSNVTILWTPESLRLVTHLGVIGNDIVASDGRSVLRLPAEGGIVVPIGRNGEGPGEFRRATGMSFGADGEVTILDGRLSRAIMLPREGQDVRTVAVTPPEGLRSVRDFERTADGSMLIAWERGLVDPNAQEDSVRVVRHSADGSPEQELFRVPDGVWREIGGSLAKLEPYGNRALIAMSPGGGVAVSNGMDYRIDWWRPGRVQSFLRIRREWERTPVSVDQAPAPDALAELGDAGAQIAAIVAGQEYKERKHSIDRMVLLYGGPLLVKAVDSNYTYHPYHYGRIPDLRPPHLLWEVIDAERGLVAQLLIPNNFTPAILRECSIMGILTDADGVQSVASLELEAACAVIAPPN